MSKRKIIALVIAVLAAGGLFAWKNHSSASQSATKTTPASTNSQQAAVTPAKPKPVNHCASNTTDQKLILIDTTARHMWACSGTQQQYDSPIVSGYAKLAETVTPAGTYKIYAKTTNTTLTGSDANGSWNRPVYYWMPFLSNQYGVYGFHDATWRKDSEFGNISTASKDASHGCVELPLNAAKWLYDWAPVGTQLTVT